MMYNVYTIHDTIAKEYGPPFTAVNDKVAIRAYKNTGIPERLEKDYELVRIGTFDSIEGTIIPDITYSITTPEENNVENI